MTSFGSQLDMVHNHPGRLNEDYLDQAGLWTRAWEIVSIMFTDAGRPRSKAGEVLPRFGPWAVLKGDRRQ